MIFQKVSESSACNVLRIFLYKISHSFQGMDKDKLLISDIYFSVVKGSKEQLVEKSPWDSFPEHPLRARRYITLLPLSTLLHSHTSCGSLATASSFSQTRNWDSGRYTNSLKKCIIWVENDDLNQSLSTSRVHGLSMLLSQQQMAYMTVVP